MSNFVDTMSDYLENHLMFVRRLFCFKYSLFCYLTILKLLMIECICFTMIYLSMILTKSSSYSIFYNTSTYISWLKPRRTILKILI